MSKDVGSTENTCNTLRFFQTISGYLHSSFSPPRSQLPFPDRKNSGRVRGNTSIIQEVLKYIIKNGALNPVLKELLAVCVPPTQLTAIRHTMIRPRKNFRLVDKELGLFRTAVLLLLSSGEKPTLMLTSESSSVCDCRFLATTIASVHDSKIIRAKMNHHGCSFKHMQF